MSFERETQTRPRHAAEAQAGVRTDLRVEEVRVHAEESVLYAVGESDLHGQGVFARTPIRSGERIGRFEGVPTEQDGTYVLWIIDENENDLGIEGWNELRFLNHADPPNAEFAGQELFALCDVDVGSEILIHYGEEWENHAS